MKIKITTKLRDFKGEVMLDEKKKPIEARVIIGNAINLEDQQHILTAEKKNQAFQIGIKLWKNDVVDLTVDQCAFIKERVGFFYSPVIYGRICELIEGVKPEETKTSENHPDLKPEEKKQ